jgi:hypothetical protein
MSNGVHRNEEDNLTRWDGARAGHYEVYYLKFNDLERARAYWLRYTMLAPQAGVGEPVCELWAVAFDLAQPGRNYARKLTLPAGELSFGRAPFYFSVGPHRLEHGACRGELGGGAGKIVWNLRFAPDPRPTFRHFPLRAMYDLPLPKTKVLAPNLSLRVSGELTAFGERRELHDLPGHQAHIWGTKHAVRWAWANCNVFQNTPAPVVFEALSAQIAVGPVTLPHLSLCALRIGDEEYVFNRPAGLLRASSRYDLRLWELTADDGRRRLRAAIRNDPRHMVGVTYRDPDGETRVCNNSKLADMTVTLEERRGREWVGNYRFESAPHTVAYEVVGPRPHPGVRVLI